MNEYLIQVIKYVLEHELKNSIKLIFIRLAYELQILFFFHSFLSPNAHVFHTDVNDFCFDDF